MSIDTSIARAAEALLAEAAPPFLVNHSHRTFAFGVLLVEAPDMDIEAAFIASMLHDVGLTDAFAGAESFEKVGAEAAARFLEARGWAPARIRLVEQAIIRHTDLEPHDRPELAVVQRGAALDVTGRPRRALEDPRIAEVVRRHPRLDFADGMLALYHREIDRQPTGTFAGLEESLRLSQTIQTNPFQRSPLSGQRHSR